MNKIESLFVFVIIKEEEQILAWPDTKGIATPLVYLSYQAVLDDNIIESVRGVAKKNGFFVELREYRFVPLSEEKFYPIPTEHTA